MEELELNDGLLMALKEHMEMKNMPYNTIRTYTYGLEKLFKEHKILSKETLPAILKKMKHQNQRAILNLINTYCFYTGIDFKLILPKINRGKRKLTANLLSLPEVELMIESAPKPYNLMLECIFKIGGGLRISEAIKLSWQHFNWVSWLSEGGLGIIKIIQSKSGDRTISVPGQLMQKLYDYAVELQILNEFRIPKPGMIFPMDVKHNKAFMPDLKAYDLEKWKDLYVEHAYHYFVYHVLKKHCIPALGRKINVHALRHTRATQLYDDKGIPIEIIQKLLGHKDISTTMIYTKISNKKVFEAMKDIN